jgi:pantothenate kinase type III
LLSFGCITMTNLHNGVNLLIDIGNTSIKILLLPINNDWMHVINYPIHTYACYSDNLNIDIGVYLHTVYLKIIDLVGLSTIQTICVSCVNDMSYAYNFMRFFTTAVNIVYCEVQNAVDGLINDYQYPKKLGIDRWLACTAAYNLYPVVNNEAIIIISCGTATTIDFIFKQHFIGGYIIPGFLTMQKALFKHTAELEKKYYVKNNKLIDLKIQTLEPQLTTDACIDCGILTAQIAFLEKNIEAFLKNKNIVKYKCLLHGGYAYALLPFLNFKYIICEHIIMLGIAKFLKNQGLN